MKNRPSSATRRGILRFALLAGTAASLSAALGSIQADSEPARSEPTIRTGIRLIMVEDPGCPVCARWEMEVGRAYANSREGAFAPLIRRRRGHSDIANYAGIIYSPTFVVVRDGVEVGRIVGYPGADFFWGLLGRILVREGFSPEAA